MAGAPALPIIAGYAAQRLLARPPRPAAPPMTWILARPWRYFCAARDTARQALSKPLKHGPSPDHPWLLTMPWPTERCT